MSLAPRMVAMLRENALLTVCQLCCLRHIPPPPLPAHPHPFIAASEAAVASQAGELLSVAEQLLGQESAGHGEELEAASFLMASLCRHPTAYTSIALQPLHSTASAFDAMVAAPSKVASPAPLARAVRRHAARAPSSPSVLFAACCLSRPDAPY